MNCPLCERVDQTTGKRYPFLIHEFKNSYLYLGEHQFYRGYSVLVTKNHYREMTDIPVGPREEVFQELMTAHQVLQDVFRPKKMNLCSLGNVVDHVHWHFFPRYADEATFKNPPFLQMHLFEGAKTTPDEREKIIGLLKNHF